MKSDMQRTDCILSIFTCPRLTRFSVSFNSVLSLYPRDPRLGYLILIICVQYTNFLFCVSFHLFFLFHTHTCFLYFPVYSSQDKSIQVKTSQVFYLT